MGLARSSIAQVEEAAVLDSFEELSKSTRSDRRSRDCTELNTPGQNEYDEMTFEEPTGPTAGDFRVAMADYLGQLETYPNNLFHERYLRVGEIDGWIRIGRMENQSF